MEMNTTDRSAYPVQICSYPELAPTAWCALYGTLPPAMAQRADLGRLETGETPPQLKEQRPVPAPLQCNEATLLRSVSKAGCIYGSSFGCSQGPNIWVSNGCRGLFRCGVVRERVFRSVATMEYETLSITCGNTSGTPSVCECTGSRAKVLMRRHGFAVFG